MQTGQLVPTTAGGHPPVPKPSTSTRFTHQEMQSVLPTPTRSGGKVEYECPKCFGRHLQFFGADSFKCQNGCDSKDIATIFRAKLTTKNKRSAPKAPPPGLTLEAYSALKNLPVAFLKTEFGLYDTKYRGVSVVAFPYDGNGTIKYRMGPTSEDYEFKKGSKPSLLPPYGYSQLEKYVAECGLPEAVFVVEGESDTQTMWLHGFPTVGTAAKSWQEKYGELPALKSVAQIYVVREPKREDVDTDAGLEFVTKVGVSFPPGKVRAISLRPHKDPNDLWVNGALIDDGEFDIILRDAMEQGVVPPSPPKEPPAERPSNIWKTDLGVTDLGNAKRLVDAHGQTIRYNHTDKRWYIWDDTRWALDETDGIIQLAKGVVKSILVEASLAERTEDRETLVNHEQRSEAENRINAMVSLAESDVPILTKQLDSDPMLLNVLNGTLDLLTGELREHRREDFITKMAPVVYDPTSECPLWLKYLNDVTAGNTDLMSYLQQCVGYSLTGKTTEHSFFILFGIGRNGKTTFIETTSFVLGDYAQTADINSFMITKGDRVRSDIAHMKGARVISAIESEKGKRLAEALIKSLTGGDTIRSRHLYGREFEFSPQFKLWIGTNSKPKIYGTDEGIWSRIRLIPFTVYIPPEKRDLDLKDKLKQQEASGILRWALEGLATVLKVGRIVVPPCVEQATTDYRGEQDSLGHFLAEPCVTLSGNAKSKARELYASFKSWAVLNGEWEMSEREFSQALVARGFEQYKAHGGVRMWKGIGLVEQKQNDELPF